MKPKKLDDLWHRIEADLRFDTEELGREHLYHALSELPEFLAPDHVWPQIEKNIDQPKLRFKRTYGVVAAASVLFLVGMFMFIQHQRKQTPIQFAKVELSKESHDPPADTSAAVFTELKEATCSIKPSYCLSERFIQSETEYKELLAMQSDILEHANMYDNSDQMDAMLLKLEDRKKSIEQELMAQLN